MNQRTLFLLVGAGLVGLLYFGDQVYRNYIEKPAADREKQLKKIEQGIDKANDLIAQELSLQKQLDAYEKMSLPFDREVTRTRYQDWLLGLVKSAGFTGTSVDASQPRTLSIERQNPRRNQSDRKVVLVRYSYSLRCRGSLQQLVSLLYQFYRSGHLHKIRSLGLNPSGGGTMLDVAMTIEALALMRTDRDTQLTTAQVNRLQVEDEFHYAGIARRNIFSRTGQDILSRVRVSAITFGQAGKPQVWLKNETDNQSQVYHNDEQVQLDAHRVEVLDIQTGVVLFLIDGQPVTVELGQSLMSPSPAESSDSTPSSTDQPPVPESNKPAENGAETQPAASGSKEPGSDPAKDSQQPSASPEKSAD